MYSGTLSQAGSFEHFASCCKQTSRKRGCAFPCQSMTSFAGLNLALQLEEAPIGAVETLRQDRCNVKERGRVARE
jgi:hypothetical protein